MIDRVRQLFDGLFSTGQQDRIDGCVECGDPSPPGANRCADCLGDVTRN